MNNPNIGEKGEKQESRETSCVQNEDLPRKREKGKAKVRTLVFFKPSLSNVTPVKFSTIASAISLPTFFSSVVSKNPIVKINEQTNMKKEESQPCRCSKRVTVWENEKKISTHSEKKEKKTEINNLSERSAQTEFARCNS